MERNDELQKCRLFVQSGPTQEYQRKWYYVVLPGHSQAKRKQHVAMSNAFIIFVPAFPMERVGEAAAPGGLKIPHGQQRFQIIILAPHQDGTK